MNTNPRKLGRYQVVREIGRGAMGVVYKAYDPVIEREVAIKAIQLAFQVSAEEKQIYLNRFYREAKAAGKLNHANIVTIYDVDEDKETGTPFIVMEYLEGTTLQEIIAGGIFLPFEDVTNVMMQIADALHYAHSQGVVHRDVKSANVLILSGMKAKIMDFGIARLPSSDLTQSGQFMGTPNYMSPEQVEGNAPVDGRSDLFSLGIIFYMLLTGERPFSGDTFTAVSYKIAHVDPLPPSKINPSIPPVFDRIVAKLLAKDPAQRYESGEKFVEELNNLGEEAFRGGSVQPDTDVTVLTNAEELSPVTSEKLALNEKSIGSHPTVTLFQRENYVRFAALLVFVAAVALAAVYFPSRNASSIPQKTPAPGTSSPVQEPDPQVVIRSRLDLAVNYYRNGFYDRCIQETIAVLDLDPNNQEAKRYLQMAREKKRSGQEKQKATGSN